jgi:WD40 repeat protein
MPGDLDDRERPRRLDEVIAAYLSDYPSGQGSNPQELLARHPDLADELKEFLAVDQQLRAATGPIRALLRDEQRQGAQSSVTTPWERPPGGEEELALSSFGDYDQLEKLGGGGMGVVYKARQVSLNRIVALKMILAGQFASADDVERFRAEAAAVANLDHPHIVPVYEVGAHEGQHYFTMKLIGSSLAEYQSQASPAGLPPQQAARIVATVARAVHHAHQHGILHRDLKPHNVLLDAGGQPYVTDFGLACRTTVAEQSEGVIVGTPSYMAPEQAAGRKKLTTAVDVYGLGAILYEALTGCKPFRAATVRDTLEQVCTQPPVRPRQRNPRVPRDLEAICLKCLNKDPQGRYASAAAVADDLQRYLDGQPVLARPVRAPERLWKWGKRHPGRAALMNVTALALLGLLLGALWAWDNERRWRAREHRLRHAAQMNLAWEEWKRGHVERVRELLAEFRPGAGQEDVRGFAWRHLWRRCRHDLSTLRGHTAGVYGLAFSPTEDLLASAGADGTVRLWSVRTGEARGVLRGHKGMVVALAFAPDGTLASACHDGVVRLWDVAGQEVREKLLWEANEPVSGLDFSRDGKTLAASSHDGSVTLWDVKTNTIRKRLKAPGGWLTCVALTPDGKTVAAGGKDGSVVLWDVVLGKELLPRPTRHGDWVGMVAFSPDGRLLASGGYDNRVLLWDVHTGKPHGEVRADNRAGIAVAFTPDGKGLAIGGRGLVLLWDLAKDKVLRVLKGHTGIVNTVRFSRDGKTLASGDAYGSVNLWDPATGKAAPLGRDDSPWPSQGNLKVSGPANAVAFSRSGRLVAAAGRGARGEGEVVVWDANTWKRVGVLGKLGGQVLALAFGRQDEVLAAGGEDGSVRLWETDTLRDKKPRERTFKGHAGGLTSLSFSPDGTILATGGLDKTVKLWDVAGGKELATLSEHGSAVSAVAFSPDGKTLASGSYDKTVILWDVAARQPRARLAGHLDYVNAVAFSPDGRTLATAGDDLLVKLWDVKSGGERRTLRGHSSAVWGVAFTPDGGTLATAGDDLTIKLWDLAIGQPQISFEGHTQVIRAVAFSPDGNTMVTAGEDKAVILWRAATAEEVRRAGD